MSSSTAPSAESTAGGLTTSATVAAHVAARIAAARTYLFEKGLYLADPDTLNKVEWVRDGKAHKLAIRRKGKLHVTFIIAAYSYFLHVA